MTSSEQQGLKKGPWTAAEDAVLMQYVREHGEGNWNAVQKETGLMRCGKSCRLRWANHLRPNLKKGAFSPEEERTIIHLHAKMGNKWARMAAQLPGRTDNEVKNYWNTRLKRRERAGLPIYPEEMRDDPETDDDEVGMRRKRPMIIWSNCSSLGALGLHHHHRHSSSFAPTTPATNLLFPAAPIPTMYSQYHHLNRQLQQFQNTNTSTNTAVAYSLISSSPPDPQLSASAAKHDNGSFRFGNMYVTGLNNRSSSGSLDAFLLHLPQAEPEPVDQIQHPIWDDFSSNNSLNSQLPLSGDQEMNLVEDDLSSLLNNFPSGPGAAAHEQQELGFLASSYWNNMPGIC